MTQLIWFRRDLRSNDHHALFKAQQIGSVVGLFIFDAEILASFPKTHPALPLLIQAVYELKRNLEGYNIPLVILHDSPANAFSSVINLLKSHNLAIKKVHANRDYEPDTIKRDQDIAHQLNQHSIEFSLYKDQVIFDQNEIIKADGKPYTIFTPYKNAWLKRFSDADCVCFNTHTQPLLPRPLTDSINRLLTLSLTELGFVENTCFDHQTNLSEHAANIALHLFKANIDEYHHTRDFPALDKTARISHHLRFGTLSIRQCVAFAKKRPTEGAATWLNELIWREFYQQLLWHFPNVVHESFKAQYRTLIFENNETYFDAWCAGQTGYPIIDAAMRQLNQTGFMHNRLRMIVASFLCKDLLIDWRWGEQYFKEKLIDYDLAANNGGWQWSASTGCDAQPYFRIFNPILQSQKFDKDGVFIKKYAPELNEFGPKDIHFPATAKYHPFNFILGRDYPKPIVDHAKQKISVINLYKTAAKY